jgi:hypothetical protein
VSLLPQQSSTVPGGSTGSSDTNISVNISQASLQLGLFELSSGQSWLLPVWELSGPESGSSVVAGSTFSSPVLAVSSQFVQVQPGPVSE